MLFLKVRFPFLGDKFAFVFPPVKIIVYFGMLIHMIKRLGKELED